MAVSAPVLLVDLPPLLDYPNHLARAVALAAQGTDLPAAQIYQSDWGIIPNLGGDVILVLLLKFLPPLAAGQALLILVLGVMTGGIILYARAVFGRWTVWSFAGPIAAYNGLFLMGFLNFCLAIGLALAVAAWWTTQRPVRPYLAVMGAAVGISVIWFCHLAGALFCMMLIGARELAWVVEERSHMPTTREVLGRLLALVLVCLPAILLYFLTEFSGAEVAASWFWDFKWWRIVFPAAAYYPLVDTAIALFLAAVLVVSALTQGLRVDRAGAVVLLACGLAAVLAPFEAMGGAWLDVRLAMMAWLLMFACIAPRFEGSVGRVTMAVTFAVFALKLGSIGMAWTRAQPEIAQVRAALTCAPKLSRILIAGTGSDPRKDPMHRMLLTRVPVYIHLGALALIDRGAFYPSMATIKGQHPITVRAPYDSLARPHDEPLYLEAVFKDQGAAKPSGELTPYAASFDFILLLGANKESGPLPPVLRIECDTGFAKLLRILPQLRRP